MTWLAYWGLDLWCFGRLYARLVLGCVVIFAAIRSACSGVCVCGRLFVFVCGCAGCLAGLGGLASRARAVRHLSFLARTDRAASGARAVRHLCCSFAGVVALPLVFPC